MLYLDCTEFSIKKIYIHVSTLKCLLAINEHGKCTNTMYKKQVILTMSQLQSLSIIIIIIIIVILSRFAQILHKKTQGLWKGDFFFPSPLKFKTFWF